MHKTKLTILLILLPLFNVIGQETILKGRFPIRDFQIKNDSITYIEKWDVKVAKLGDVEVNSRFIGGYGLKLTSENNLQMSITASNELEKETTSIRFFNKKIEKESAVYFYKGARIIDFYNISELNIVAISLTNNKIIIIDYNELPSLRKLIEIDNNALSRKIIYKDNSIFFITDKGKFYSYNLSTYKKNLLFEDNEVFTDFTIFKNEFIIFTLSGKIICYNHQKSTNQQIKIKDNFIISSYVKNNHLFCGSWNGQIYKVDLENFIMIDELIGHKRSVINIKYFDNDYIYSSSLDKTIKKWKLKKI